MAGFLGGPRLLIGMGLITIASWLAADGARAEPVTEPADRSVRQKLALKRLAIPACRQRNVIAGAVEH